MTPKQEERIRKKIAQIRKELAADKKHWGGFYHDGGGLRYLPPEHFIKLKDYKGGLRYLRWFNCTFPDDVGYPLFLFEWTLILYKTGNLKEAVKKAMQTFADNTYLIDKFLGKELLLIEKEELSNWEEAELAGVLKYSVAESELADFAEWLNTFQTSGKFYEFANELIEIDKKLATESSGKKRNVLLNRRNKLLDEQ